MRPYFYTAIAVAIIAAAAALYLAGRDHANDRNARERAEDTINSSKDFNDAITADPDGCGWFDRVHRACAD